jgi:hypothetical protein
MTVKLQLTRIPHPGLASLARPSPGRRGNGKLARGMYTQGMSEDKKRRQYSLLVLMALPASILFWTWFSYSLSLVWMDRTWWFIKGDLYSSKISFLVCNIIAALIALLSYPCVPSDSKLDLQAFIARNGRLVSIAIAAISFTSMVSLGMTSIHHKAFGGDLTLAFIATLFSLGWWRFEKSVVADAEYKE